MKQQVNTFLKLVSEFIFWIWGWKIIGTLPKINKYVAIVAPHRAGAGDVFRGLLTKIIQDVPPVKFPAKIEAVRRPIVGHFLKWIGAVAVDREHIEGGAPKGKVTEILLNHMMNNIKAVTAFAVEGTRTHGKKWRTGFYQVSLGANAPVIMIAFDYKCKLIWISEPLVIIGNRSFDIQNIKDWYKLRVPEYEPVIFEEDF